MKVILFQLQFATLAIIVEKIAKIIVSLVYYFVSWSPAYQQLAKCCMVVDFIVFP